MSCTLIIFPKQWRVCQKDAQIFLCFILISPFMVSLYINGYLGYWFAEYSCIFCLDPYWM